jgi:Type II CAAX prenyl endopeptidase Rce1-like
MGKNRRPGARLSRLPEGEALSSMVENRYNWREFWTLWVASLLGTAAVLPYAVTLLASKPQKTPVPLPVVLALQFAQTGILLGLAVGLGLWLSRRIGLGAPLIEGWLRKEKIGPQLKKLLAPSVGLGIFVGLVILGLDAGLFRAHLPQAFRQVRSPAWQGLLASIYGGIAEEVLTRLFLLSLLAWLLLKASKRQARGLSAAPFWGANVMAALLFGLGHLPAARLLAPLTSLVIARTLLLNGLPGMVYGYLFWRHGLESAMLAHFSTDLVLHVIGAI